MFHALISVKRERYIFQTTDKLEFFSLITIFTQISQESL